jgi:hypothetical protein
MNKELITQEYLKSIYEYKDGNLYRKISLYQWKKGDKVGTIHPSGYVKVQLGSVKYLVHRLIFLYHYGYLPKLIDHIDGDSLNNKIENLREATVSQNCCNKKMQSDNKSGFRNVSKKKGYEKWCVQIQVNKKKLHIGYFLDLELADLVATMAREKYHGRFARYYI